MRYLTKKEDVLESIIWSNFEYEVSKVELLEYTVNILIIRVIIDAQVIEMQPILLEPIECINTIMEQLWIKQNTSHFKLEKGRLSLKTDVVFSDISKNLDKSSERKFLDIGFSNSSLYEYLLKKNSNIVYTGLDLIGSDDAFNNKIGSVTNIPFENSMFDVVNLSMLLLNISNPETAINEALRVLKNNGKIFITDINSKYYKACGVYIKRENEWNFIKVIDTNSIYFTIKKLGRTKKYLHAYHHYNLYSNILREKEVFVQSDRQIGITEELIKSGSDNAKKSIRSFAKDLKYPSFHSLIGVKNGEKCIP